MGATSDEQQCPPHGALVSNRELRLLMLLPQLMLVIATALSVGIIDSASTAKVAAELGLAVLASASMALIWVLRPRWETQRPLMVGIYSVLLGLMLALVLLDPLFGFYTWTGYIWGSLLFTRRWRLLAYVPVAVIVATSQHGGLPKESASSWIGWIAFVAINMIAAVAVSWFARTREEEHVRRKQMVDDLTEANAKLEDTLRENAGLHAQLVAQAREAGVTDERQRMAGEIHDTIAQGLVGIITQLEAAAQAPRSDPERQRRMEAAIELARESLAEARRSVRALAPAHLEHASLPDALGDVARRWSDRSGVAAKVMVTGTPRGVADEVELALLRTAQEALANVAKHARAERVGLTLSYMDDVVTLDVRDDGVGFALSTPSLHGGGFGLTAMRKRVEGLGGTLEIETEPRVGTTVAASISTVMAAGAPSAPGASATAASPATQPSSRATAPA
jgi:signal transduction histidine kinase